MALSGWELVAGLVIVFLSGICLGWSWASFFVHKKYSRLLERVEKWKDS